MAILLMMLAATAPAAEPVVYEMKTHTYKTVDGVQVQADVHRSADKKIQPVVVWIHGGALVNGHRGEVPGNLRDLCMKEGYTLVSLDYRLAPEVKLPAIDDIKDAFRWLRAKGPDELHIDPERIVVTGGSAGGYLTMMTGSCVEPKPLALVAYWGYGDVDGDWYVKPSEFYRKQPLVSKEDAYAGIDKQVVSGAVQPDARKARGRYYLYLRQNGLWTKEVTGFDPKERDQLTPFCPVRNLTKDYPPILMVHGTIDTDVPYELSKAMADGLQKVGGKFELVTVENAGHGLAGGDPKQNRDAHERALAFIRRQLGNDSIDQLKKLGAKILLEDNKVIGVSLSERRVTDADLVHLKDLAHLQELDLTRTGVTSAGLESLAGLVTLKKLFLTDTKVDDGGMSSLKGMKSLEVLGLSGTRIGDPAMKHLQALSGLKSLFCLGTSVTDAGVEQLQKALPQCRIAR